MLPREIELDDMEKMYKAQYLNGGQDLVTRPMTFSEYESLDASQKKYYEIMEIHHRRVAKNMGESTVYNVFDGPDNKIEIVRHSRYSYPIMHNHEYVEIIYVYSGSCIHFMEDQSLEMSNGDLCILAPNTIHSISATRDDAILINIMLSKKLFTESFMNMMQRVPSLAHFFESVLYDRNASPYILYPTGDDPWLHELIFHMLSERKEKHHLYNESVSLLVQQMFIHILRYYELNAIVSDPFTHSQDAHIVSLLAYINENIQNVSLEETAKFFGYNKTYLSQLLNKYTGKTFTVYVNELRMKKAAQLLMDPSIKITDIGAEVGCYDASHFNRKFTKVFQMSPKEYRNKYLHPYTRKAGTNES